MSEADELVVGQAEGIVAAPTRRLWDLLDAVCWHIDNTPSDRWDQAVVELAEEASVGLARRVREISAERMIEAAAPCGSTTTVGAPTT